MRTLFSSALWLALTLVLMSISNYFINEEFYEQNYSVWSVLWFHIGLIWLAIYALGVLKKSKSIWLKILLWLTLFIIIFTAFSEILIYKYSGVAFVDQTFLHFEPQSLMVGFSIYPIKYVTVILLIALFSLLLLKYTLTIKPTKGKNIAALFSLVVIGFFHYGSSMGRLIANFQQYKQKQYTQLQSAEEILPYEAFGIRPIGIQKEQISASFTVGKKNLIIVYLESFSHVFHNSERYPELTPEINQLIKKHGQFKDYQSTANFTIQGILSSLCGLIPKLETGNNISSNDIPYQSLICLPHVLNHLNYNQEFVGGARKSFANKEAILNSIGLNPVWGWLDYQKPKNYQTNDWGLQDSDLFQFALERVEYLMQQDQPFHLSILTLSTHLDGNPDPTCPDYKAVPEAHKFILGIHCTDYLLGKFINSLDEKGVLDDTTVLITSDHGVFPVELIKNLFGKGFDRNQLLGILINGHDFNKSLPFALYDIPEILLASMGIETNASFINGRSPDEISPERFILRENKLNKNLKMADGCNENDKIEPPIDPCENERLVQKSWGYAATFNENKEKTQLEKIQINTKAIKNHTVVDLVINQQSVMPYFMAEGYPVTLLERKYRNHIYVLVYDIENRRIHGYNAFQYNSKDIDYFDRLMLKKPQENMLYVVFTEKGTETASFPEWNTVFSLLGSEKFAYPEQSYLGLFKMIDRKMSYVEWSEDLINMSVDIANYFAF